MTIVPPSKSVTNLVKTVIDYAVNSLTTLAVGTVF